MTGDLGSGDGGEVMPEERADVAVEPGPGDAATGDGPAADDGGGGEEVVVSCGTPLADRVRVAAVSVAPAQVQLCCGGYFSPDFPVILSTLPDGSSMAAWSAEGGTVHVTPLDASDARRGPDLATAGTEVRGFVALADGAAVLVRRGDVMALVRLDASGAEVFTEDIVGGTPHDVSGARWIDDWSHEGRLAWTGSQLAAYFGQTGNHGSSGNHQGDRLVFVGAGGGVTVGWDWGCSHSLDVRLAVSGATLGPVCLSDCYPGKGIYFDRDRLVRDEPSGDCYGRSGAGLGGLVPAADGFLLSFTSPEGRGSSDVGLVHISAGGAPGTPVFLTDTAGVQESGAHLARYGDDLLAAWLAGETPTLAVVTAAGEVVEGPTAVTAEFAEKDDFVNWPGGDAGWAYAWGSMSELKVVRVALCR